MDTFLIKAAFGSETLIREWPGTYISESTLTRGNVVRLRMLSIVSKNQNKLGKCCIYSFFLKTDVVAIGRN